MHDTVSSMAKYSVAIETWGHNFVPESLMHKRALKFRDAAHDSKMHPERREHFQKQYAQFLEEHNINEGDRSEDPIVLGD